MEEAEFIKDPNRWPCWPTLPLVRKADGKAGYLLGDPRLPLKVYEGNIFSMTAQDPVIAEFQSVKALIDEWRVD